MFGVWCQISIRLSFSNLSKFHLLPNICISEIINTYLCTIKLNLIRWARKNIKNSCWNRWRIWLFQNIICWKPWRIWCCWRKWRRTTSLFRMAIPFLSKTIFSITARIKISAKLPNGRFNLQMRHFDKIVLSGS